MNVLYEWMPWKNEYLGRINECFGRMNGLGEWMSFGNECLGRMIGLGEWMAC